MTLFRRLLDRLFGPVCPSCKRRAHSTCRRRMNTSYVNDESNHIVECAECFEDTQNYWAERWKDYYNDVRP